jgi:hypothetical protein
MLDSIDGYTTQQPPDLNSQTQLENMVMLALTSATGKLGSAVLNAILDNKLVDPKQLVVCVSEHE